MCVCICIHTYISIYPYTCVYVRAVPGKDRAESRVALPIDDERFIGSLLVTHRTRPCWLLLIHLQVQGGIEALQVGAGEGAARDGQAHLPELRREESSGQSPAPQRASL